MKISARRFLVMKGGIESTLFICTLVLLVFLSGAPPADAHDTDIDGHSVEEHNYTTPAQEVDPADRQSVYNFLLHLRTHIEEVPNVTVLARIREKIAEEGGDWKHETFYVIRMSPEGQVVQHPYHPLAASGSLSDLSETVQELVRLANEKSEGDCVQYDRDGASRWACAAKFKFLEGPTGIVSTWVVGYHHDFEEVSFANNTCPYYVTETSAIEVENAKDTETLKKFVDEFTEYYLELRRVRGTAALVVQRHCQVVLPWKYGSVYLWRWVFPGYRSVFNAHLPDIEGQTLYFEDGNDCNLADEITRVMDGAERECKSLGYLSEEDKKATFGDKEGAFFEYLWDDPSIEGDEIDIHNDCPNGPRTCAPGTSHKVGYVRAIPSSSGRSTVLIGSGYYPEAVQGDEDDDGCAIAGVGHKAGTGLLNLFLIVSVLFSAALWKNRSKEKPTTRRKKSFMRNGTATFFVCTLALLVFFSGASPAGAHGGNSDADVTAGDVGVGDMEKMREFVLHAKAHWEGVGTPDENIEFERSLATEGSDWNNGTIYLMAITEEGSILVHGEDPSVQNGTLFQYSGEGDDRVGIFHPEIQELIDAANEGEEGGCMRYGLGESGNDMRVACAVKFKHPVWNANSDSRLILVAGYHRDPEQHEGTEISFAEIDCPYFAEVRSEPPYFFQGVSADDVVDNETLKDFVEQFVVHFDEQVNLAGRDYADLAVVRNCWRILPWRYQGVYLFIMTEEKLVFFNGNTPVLENGTIDLVDDNECNVGNEIISVIRGEGRQCKDLGLLPENPDSEGAGFVEYLWDDPSDDIPADIRAVEEGRAPGSVPKLSYVQQVEFLGQNFIIGSGYHPVGGEDGSDGCAITGSGSGVKGAVFSVLLMVSILFSAVSWRNRRSAG